MIVTLDKVSKTYPGVETVHAIQRVSLSIEVGEIVVLFGPSGAGKSTLLLLAAGVLEPDEGLIVSHGRNLATLSKDQVAGRLRDQVGISYQNPRLLAGQTVLDNVALKLLSGPTRLRDARRLAAPWLAKTGLAHRLEHYPHQLSGGEQQRVGLARALIGNPSLLLLDEPTAGLDSRRGAEALDIVSAAANHGAGVLLVTHDDAARRVATRTLELHDGGLVECRRERAA